MCNRDDRAVAIVGKPAEQTGRCLGLIEVCPVGLRSQKLPDGAAGADHQRPGRQRQPCGAPLRHPEVQFTKQRRLENRSAPGEQGRRRPRPWQVARDDRHGRRRELPESGGGTLVAREAGRVVLTQPASQSCGVHPSVRAVRRSAVAHQHDP
jgi:hypothetical protein